MNVYNYNHLFYFYVVARSNGVTAAASHLNTSQSSLSTQIKTLESTLGKTLFKKNGRNIELTETGKELFSYCRRAFEIFDEMFDQLAKSKSSMGLRITIGVSVDVERPFITEALAKISKHYPLSKRPLLNLMSLPTNQLTQLMRLGELDLLLSTSSQLGADIELNGEFNFPIGAFVAPEIKIKNDFDSIEQFFKRNKHSVVLPSHLTSLREEIDFYFSRRKISTVCVFESNIIAAVIRAASDGLGVTLLPMAYVSRELKAGKLVQLNHKPMWKHRMFLLSKRNNLDESKQTFALKLSQQLDLMTGLSIK